MRASADLERTEAIDGGVDRGVGGAVCAVGRRSRGAVGAAALSLALLVSACSGDGDADSSADGDTVETEETPSASPSETASAEAEEAPTLTAPGSQLAFGDTATVEYSAGGDTATLDLTVRSAMRGSLDDFAGFDTQDSLVRNANFFYVRVRAKNVGEQRFGNAEVPLWGISGQDTLLPPVNFKETEFAPCPTETLPRRFRPGDSFSTCLVFLSPKKGSLEGVSYRPTVEFTAIEWRGRVERSAGGGNSNDRRDRGND